MGDPRVRCRLVVTRGYGADLIGGGVVNRRTGRMPVSQPLIHGGSRQRRSASLPERRRTVREPLHRVGDRAASARISGPGVRRQPRLAAYAAASSMKSTCTAVYGNSIRPSSSLRSTPARSSM